MNRARAKTQMGAGMWIAWGVIAAAFLYATANTYAINLGAAHHDAFCPDHGWAVTGV
jgi:hypothetical protein